MHTATLKIRVEPGTDALYRVLCVCHRRGAQIVALIYADDEITLTIREDDWRSRHLARWLDALRDVRSVCEVRSERRRLALR